MELLLPITEKRNGDIKAINIAVGIKHRTSNGYNKSNGLCPILNTASVILTGVIDAHDHKAVAMLDIGKMFVRKK